MNTKIYENIRVLDPAGGVDLVGHVIVADGKIEAVAEGPVPEGASGVRTDGTGLVMAPGFFDLRAHFREPGFEDAETIASGSASAAAGGFTDVVCMPNTRPAADTPGAILLVRERGARVGLTRVHPAAALSKGMEGKTMNEYGDLVDAGAVALTDDVVWIADSGLMRHAMEYSVMLGVPVISHPEDASLSREGFMHEGSWSTRLGLRGLPAAAEVSAVARDIELAQLTGASLHIPHVSCRASVQLIRAARERGLRVTAETTPHHVFFTDQDCRTYDTHFKMKPPLRSEDDREALVEALTDGTISAIASDHAPHTVTAKERTFAHAPFGVIGLETAFAAAHDRLVVRGPLTLSRLIELMSAAPARILGKSPVTLTRGSAADLVILDPGESWEVEGGRLRSQGRNCPWIDQSLTGRVVETLLGGRETFSLSPEE
jgi:dihydroorotase